MGYPIYGNLHIDISLTKTIHFPNKNHPFSRTFSLTKTIHFLGIPHGKAPIGLGPHQDQTDHRDGDHQGEQSLGAGGDELPI